jgi:hypothetical protein
MRPAGLLQFWTTVRSFMKLNATVTYRLLAGTAWLTERCYRFFTVRVKYHPFFITVPAGSWGVAGALNFISERALVSGAVNLLDIHYDFLDGRSAHLKACTCTGQQNTEICMHWLRFESAIQVLQWSELALDPTATLFSWRRKCAHLQFPLTYHWSCSHRAFVEVVTEGRTYFQDATANLPYRDYGTNEVNYVRSTKFPGSQEYTGIEDSRMWDVTSEPTCSYMCKLTPLSF